MDLGTSDGATGGTLHWLTEKELPTLDPQRVYVGRDISILGRTVYRSLVQFPVTSDPEAAGTPVPDLATDTGSSSDGARTWTFTLKEGVAWQDGRPVTTADLKYGLSRAFATDTLTGGPAFVLAYLDLPLDEDGNPVFRGPYASSPSARAAFDRAVTCSPDQRSITYRFNRAWADFPLAVASLRCFDPFRADLDRGADSNYDVFATGPYLLAGDYRPGRGLTLVRNPHYDAATDGNRQARPDTIVLTESVTSERIADRLVEDRGPDRAAVTDRNVPPSRFGALVGTAASRAANPTSPYVEYLLLHAARLPNRWVREALKVATDVDGFIDAGGGTRRYERAYSVVAPGVRGHHPNEAYAGPGAGDPAAARALLLGAGVFLPFAVTFSYPGGNATQDRQVTALQEAWDRAGFSVTLLPLPGRYHEVVEDPAHESDIMWATWGADWPSPATVLPPIFDHRINLTTTSNGQDYGRYRSDVVSDLIDNASEALTTEAALPIYQQIDDQLAADVAYIPLAVAKLYLLRGSRVVGHVLNPATNMYPDLGSLGVAGK